MGGLTYMRSIKEYYKNNKYYGKRFFHIDDPDLIYTIVKYSSDLRDLSDEGNNIWVEWFDYGNSKNGVSYSLNSLFKNIESGVWVITKRRKSV